MLFIQIPTPTPSMHRKLTLHEKCCIRNNQLPTKSPVQITDDSYARYMTNSKTSTNFVYFLVDEHIPKLVQVKKN